jgi:hypothetical protein
MSFKKNKYKVVKKAIPKEVAEFGFKYMQLCAESDYFLSKNGFTIENNFLIGNFKDKQVPGSYAKYADRFMETLLLDSIPLMEKHTKLTVVPTYSYTRLYKTGNILERHKDRPSCEISTTLNLGGDPWPIFLSPKENVGIPDGKKITFTSEAKGIKINLEPGDMLIYSGCELEHWREPFEGNICSQVFLHYNNADGPFKRTNLYDRRPILGIPKTKT